MKPLALLAVALCGCWSGRAAEPAGAGVGAGESAAAKVTSCAVEPPVRVKQQAVLNGWLGRIGDRSWIQLRRGDGLGTMLAGLGADGTLVELRLGEEPPATYADGTRLWIVKPSQRTGEIELVRIELGGPRPELAGREPLGLGTIGVDAVAVGASRVLVGDVGRGMRLQLFDRARNRPLGTPAAISTTDFGAPALRCTGDRCFALGVEGDGPSRRIFVERFAPDGAHEHEVLAGDHLASYHLAAAGGRWFALWTAFGESGVFARELDAAGRPLTPRTKIFVGGTTDFEVVQDPKRLRIAVKTADGWSLGVLEPRSLQPMVAAPTGLPKEAYFLIGAALSDGTLLAGFSSSVDYQGGFHSWSGRAWSTFVRHGEAAEAALPLASAFGDGRGGIAAFPLVAPGHAAVLVVPQGPESETGGELVVLRRPCAEHR
jgi:hypothetical protein